MPRAKVLGLRDKQNTLSPTDAVCRPKRSHGQPTFRRNTLHRISGPSAFGFQQSLVRPHASPGWVKQHG
jgi:hypothetical protein